MITSGSKPVNVVCVLTVDEGREDVDGKVEVEIDWYAAAAGG